METIMLIVNWVRANGADLALVVVQVIGVASIVVKLTPTPKDDAILGKIKKVIAKFIALN